MLFLLFLFLSSCLVRLLYTKKLLEILNSCTLTFRQKVSINKYHFTQRKSEGVAFSIVKEKSEGSALFDGKKVTMSPSIIEYRYFYS